MKKEIIKNLEITDTAYGGAGVGRSESGQVIFVQKTVEGDIVEAEIFDDKKSFAFARLIKIVKPSHLRVKPLCSAADICGGCSFAHIDYEAQKNIKKHIVLNQFRKYKHNMPEIKIVESSSKEYRLRATARSRNGKIGFFEHGTNKLVMAEKCPVIKESLYKKMKEFAEINNLSGEIYAIENDEGLSLADIRAESIDYKHIGSFEGVCINNKKYGCSNIAFNTAYGAVQVTHKSFFQANRYLLNDFQEYASSLVSNSLDIVELYAGSGFFTCALMAKGRVEAWEYEQVSANLGRQSGYNIKISDSGIFLSKIKKCDCIFLDPPRNGADKKVIEHIKRLHPYEIIYVSCNPITLARDIIRLEEKYKITDFTLYDMYPDTYHIESVVRLQRI